MSSQGFAILYFFGKIDRGNNLHAFFSPFIDLVLIQAVSKRMFAIDSMVRPHSTVAAAIAQSAQSALFHPSTQHHTGVILYCIIDLLLVISVRNNIRL